MQVVGLTGGIGTGKSTVARFLREWGVPVIDADQVSREVVQPGSPTLAALVEAFAPASIVDGHGALDRPAMRARITADIAGVESSPASPIHTRPTPADAAILTMTCTASEL